MEERKEKMSEICARCTPNTSSLYGNWKTMQQN